MSTRHIVLEVIGGLIQPHPSLSEQAYALQAVVANDGLPAMDLADANYGLIHTVEECQIVVALGQSSS